MTGMSANVGAGWKRLQLAIAGQKFNLVVCCSDGALTNCEDFRRKLTNFKDLFFKLRGPVTN